MQDSRPGLLYICGRRWVDHVKRKHHEALAMALHIHGMVIFFSFDQQGLSVGIRLVHQADWLGGPGGSLYLSMGLQLFIAFHIDSDTLV